MGSRGVYSGEENEGQGGGSSQTQATIHQGKGAHHTHHKQAEGKQVCIMLMVVSQHTLVMRLHIAMNVDNIVYSQLINA